MARKAIKIVKIQGGLGNQLFCLAFSIYLKKTNNIKLLIDSSSSYIFEQFGRKFELSKFLSKEEKITNPLLIITIKFLYKINNKLSLIFKKNNPLSFIKTESQFQRKGCNSKIEYLDGYWQDKKYVRSYNDYFIRKLIKFTEIKDKQLKHKKIMIGLHYRIKNYDYKLSQRYYYDAIKYILEKNKIEDYCLCIFTDDYKKAQNFFNNILKLKRCKIISGQIMDDFKLMCNCNHFIIAKSTLSWWAGLVVDKKIRNSTICRPRIFEFSDTQKLSIEDWVIINE